MIDFLARSIEAIAESSRWKRLSTIFFVTAILATLATPALSQEPTPSGGKEGNVSQHWNTGSDHKTTGEERGTEQSPLIVKIPEAETAEQRAAKVKQESEERAAEKFWTRGLGALTLLLSVLTLLVLFRQTNILANQNVLQAGVLKATEKSAEAADRSVEVANKSVEVMQASERSELRPHIHFSIMESIFEGFRRRSQRGEARQRSSEPPRVEFFFKNYGRSTARLKKYWRRIELSERCPSDFQPEHAGELPYETSITFMSKTNNLRVAAEQGLSDAEMGELVSGPRHLWFVTEVVFRDDLTGDRSERFRYRFDGVKFQPFYDE